MILSNDSSAAEKTPMAAYSPSLLPAVAGVEVRVMRRDGPTIAAEPDVAVRIADLWRRLPPGRQARCHNPTFEVRFLASGKVVCSGTVCWECNNIHGASGGEPFAYELDATAPVSQELLAVVQQVAGSAPGAVVDGGA